VNYDVEMGYGAMICISSFIKVGLAMQKLLGGGSHRHTDR
jgi:hypothetical protein